MKTKLLIVTLFMATATAVVFFPVNNSNGLQAAIVPTIALPVESNQRAKIEVVFVLDTTGSMGGLIEAAKEKIWSIANTMGSAQSAPEIKMGLVAYRDRGDAYVTQVFDLSSDLDSMYSTLMDFEAAGGGDGPESVNQALYEAVHNINWSQDSGSYKVVFLVGDAPSHMDYQDDVKYPQVIDAASSKGIVLNTIQCGQNRATLHQWQQMAQLGEGRFFQVDQAGSAVAVTTPFDEKIARLSEKLDHTRLYYGDKSARREQQIKLEAADKLHSKSSFASRARRATFNASVSGKANFLGKGELVDEVISGRTDLSAIDSAELPASLQTLAPEQQQAVIEEKATERKVLQKEIAELTRQRKGYLKSKVEALDGAEESLDRKIYEAVKEQAKSKGLQYDAEALSY